MVTARPRRVIVGTNDDGLSRVVDDGATMARTVRPSGAVVHEVWRQEHLPAHPADDGSHTGEMEPNPPVKGITIRSFTVPPDVDPEVAAYAESTWARTGAGEPILALTAPQMHRTNNVFVATVLSGAAYLVLESEEVLLRQGDSFVIPGSMHSWRNPFDVEATMVSTVFGQV
ncbi:cupin domain-containing protein [Rhodococcus sp. NPDC127530]|uniref:cupin domain-containing protein n=1 Tax=unclassified Rhodococcus (in: high G+C Gram-positive bacteria) TaxID=192944 RepID=UPI00362B40AD